MTQPITSLCIAEGICHEEAIGGILVS